MAESTVRIDGTVPVTGTVIATPTGTQAVSGTVSSIATKDPTITGVYVYSNDVAAGVVAANNFLSLFNPVGSGKTVIFAGAFLSCTSIAAITSPAPMRGFRITTATGGTLQATNTVAEFISTMPTQVAEIRTGNPTVTLGPAIFNSPPAVGAGVIAPVHTVPVPPGTGPFTLAPGEGIVLRTASGDVDMSWSISVVWMEA